MNVQKFFKIFIPLFTALVVLSIGGFLYYNLSYMNAPVSSAYELYIEEQEVQLRLDDTCQLNYGIRVINSGMVDRAYNQLRESEYSFTVSDPSVLTVSQEGLITPKKAGEADISLSFASMTQRVHVSCYIPLESLSLTEHMVFLEVGDTHTLKTISTPDNASVEIIPIYTSKDPSVIEVDQEGTVKALYPGSTTVWMHFDEFTDAVTFVVSAPLKGISFEEESYTLEKYKSLDLEVLYDPVYTTDEVEPEFSLITTELGTLTEEGNFTATSVGKAHIRVKAGDFEALCEVNIIAHLTGISFPYSELTIRNGESVKMPVAYEPYDTTDEIVLAFSSSDEEVAVVDAAGNVTAVGAGDTVIRATCQEFSCEMLLHVVIPVTGIELSETSLSIARGETATLSARIVPEDTTEEKYIDWASDNGKVAYVEDGVITAVGPGTCRITAYHDDFAATCTVTVYAPLKAIAFTQNNITLLEGYGTDLSIVYNPTDTTDDKTVIFESDDPSIASVSGSRLTAHREGTTAITAICGNVRCYALVKVNPYIYVSSVSLDTSSISFSTIGNTYQLTATVYPANATDASVTFVSSDNTVATVDENGLVHAAGTGDCTVTASSGGKSASVSVHVAAPNLVVVLDPGHDASHTGAYYFNVLEHVINLKVAHYCKDYLESHYSGVTVYMTHETETCMNSGKEGCLYARSLFAQQKGADIFVSMHFNACTNHNATGAQCFIQSDLNGHSWIHEESDKLGNAIDSEICAQTKLKNRGNFVTTGIIDQSTGQLTDYYAVLRHCANMGIPAVIVEHCFMDHDIDYILEADGVTISESWMQTFGIADAVGIARYLGLSEK